MALAVNNGYSKEQLPLQLQADEAVESALSAAAPAATVSLEARITISYYCDPTVDFHVSFSFLGKHYNADFVSSWDLLSRKSADSKGTRLQTQVQYHQQEQPSPSGQQQHSPQQHVHHDQQPEHEHTHCQQLEQQHQHQKSCLPRLRVQIADPLGTFAEPSSCGTADSSFGCCVTGPHGSFSSNAATSTTVSSSLSPSDPSSSSTVYSGTAPRETAAAGFGAAEECTSQSELITVCTTVPLETICFTWSLIQQVATAVVSVSVGRTCQDKGRATFSELMPRVSTLSAAAGQQQHHQTETSPVPKKSTKSDVTLSAAVKNKDKNKPRTKENKPVPFFDASQSGEFGVGRLLLASDKRLRSTSAFNDQISQLNGVHDFSIEIWCNQPPLPQSWRHLLNPVCITFLEATDVPLPTTPPATQQHTPHQQATQRQQVAGSIERKEHFRFSGQSGILKSPGTVGADPPASVYLECQWLSGAKVRTPVRPLRPHQMSHRGFEKGREKYRRGRVIWEHDVICFSGPALLNPPSLYQYLEGVPLHVELQQASDVLRQKEEAPEARHFSSQQRLSPRCAMDAGKGEALALAPGIASPLSGRVASCSVSLAAAPAARASTLPRHSAAPQRGTPKASALKVTADCKGARGTQARSPNGRRGTVTSSDVACEETNVMPAHGAADFDLGDLCRLRLKYLEIASDVYPVSTTTDGKQASEASELQEDIPTAAALLSTPLETFNAVTTKTRRTPTPFLEFGTRIMLRIQLAEPFDLPATAPPYALTEAIPNSMEEGNPCRATAVGAKADLRSKPFGLVIAVADACHKHILTATKRYVERHNMRSLELDSLDALHLEVLRADDRSHAALDILTGFILSDRRCHLLVAEGLRGLGLQSLLSRLKNEADARLWRKLLYNPRIGFPSRLYTIFDLRLRWIKLQTPLEALLQQPLMSDASTVEAQQVAVILGQLAVLLRAARMKEVTLAKALPSAPGLMRLSQMHGEDEEGDDPLTSPEEGRADLPPALEIL